MRADRRISTCVQTRQMRTTHTQEYCAPVTAANRTDWANPNRISCPKIGGENFGHLMRRLECPTNFRPTWREFCPTPGAKPSQLCPTTTHELTVRKQLAASAWGETHESDPKRSAPYRSTGPMRSTHHIHRSAPSGTGGATITAMVVRSKMRLSPLLGARNKETRRQGEGETRSCKLGSPCLPLFRRAGVR